MKESFLDLTYGFYPPPSIAPSTNPGQASGRVDVSLHPSGLREAPATPRNATPGQAGPGQSSDNPPAVDDDFQSAASDDGDPDGEDGEFKDPVIEGWSSCFAVSPQLLILHHSQNELWDVSRLCHLKQVVPWLYHLCKSLLSCVCKSLCLDRCRHVCTSL